jgi:hypothetical protein
MIKPKVVLLIFVSGKNVLTGANAAKVIFFFFASLFPCVVDAFSLVGLLNQHEL